MCGVLKTQFFSQEILDKENILAKNGDGKKPFQPQSVKKLPNWSQV